MQPDQPEYADETERMQSEADAQAEAAYERGLAEGRRQAVELVSSLLGHDLVLDRAADVDSVGFLSSAIVTAREQGRRQATEGFITECEANATAYRRRYRPGPPPPPGLVDERPRDLRSLHVAIGMELARNLARHRLLADGPWEPAEQPEAASGGVVEPSPLTAEEATPDGVVPANPNLEGDRHA